MKDATNNLNDIYDKELKGTRVDLVNQFSQWLKNNNDSFHEVNESKIVLSIFNYNPIPDAAGNINEITLTMKNSRYITYIDISTQVLSFYLIFSF